MAYRIEVNGDECISCGVCEATCPEVFKIDADGKSVPIQPIIEDLGCAQEAVDNCPTQCITVSES